MKFRLVPVWLSLALLLPWITSAPGQQLLTPEPEVLASYSWADTANILPPDWGPRRQLFDAPPGMGGKILRVHNPGPGNLGLNVLTIPKPPITADFYALRCQVRYEDVSGDGYLEMWTTFPDKSSYFTRTLGENPGDPVGKLNGTSDWRPLYLPFNAYRGTGAGGAAAGQGVEGVGDYHAFKSTDTNAHPEQLNINVILPGRGTVYLTEMQLVQVRSTPLTAPPTGWYAAHATWSNLTGIGALMGLLVILGLLVRRKRHRRAEWRRMAALDT